MNNLQEIQQKIAADLGIGALTDEQQQKLIAEFGALALQASTMAVLTAMPEDKREEFTKLLQAKDEVGAQAFIDAVVPNHEEIARQAVTEQLTRFKEFQKTV